jgi:uncharacterized protein
VIRAVIDTNVLVSGLLSPAGNEALIILSVRHGFLHPCLSEPILQEYRAVLARDKFAFPPDEIAALIATLQERGAMFAPAPASIVSPDPTDTKFLHCALAADADFIVTGNKRDFPAAPYGTIRVECR